MSNNEDLATDTAPHQKGPGSRLQTARIEQGITIDEIARQMNLNKKILESLEEDEYKDLQSPIFIRGYLRTYSRLVGVDEDETIRIFGEIYQVGDPEIKSIRSTNPEISSNDVRVKWVTYIVVVGLIALISVWWVNSYQLTNNESEALVSEQSSDLTIAEISTTSKAPEMADKPVSQQSEKQLSVMTATEIASQVNEDVGAESQSYSDDSYVETAVEDTVEAEIAINEINTTIENTEEQVVTEEAIKQEKQLAENQAAKQNSTLEATVAESDVITKRAQTGKDELFIVVNATSWGDIKDANGQKLVKDLLKQGKKYRFVGQQPFKIFLGNGFGIEITLNGESQDFSRHIKPNNTARFELGK